MFERMKRKGCKGYALEGFAAEFNFRSEMKRTYIPDRNAQEGRQYLTDIETLYTDSFDEAQLIMESQMFVGVLTRKKAEGVFQAITATGSRIGKLLGQDPSTQESVRISEEEFVNLVIPVVRITEAWGLRGERLVMDVKKKAVAVLAEMESIATSQGSLEIVKQYRNRRTTACCSFAHQTLVVAPDPTKQLTGSCIEQGAKTTVASEPCKSGYIEMVECSVESVPSATNVIDVQLDGDNLEDYEISKVVKVPGKMRQILSNFRVMSA